MKPHMNIRHESNIEIKSHRMTIDEQSLAHVMNILTDMYEDSALAVIREYSTNAADSHAEAGNENPIRVTLPSDISPTFIVKDQGVGMDEETLTKYFSKYGWSSKRETDEQVGMLGIGCKAGLAFTKQFTVHTVKDGIEILALITRESDGCGAIQIMNKSHTREPNGVEVRVPVPSVQVGRFREKAANFFKFWDRGTVLVNDSEPECIWDGNSEFPYELLDESVCFVDEPYLSYLVMGNVPYPFRHTESGQSSFAAKIPIGSVDFTPSRESLNMTKRTQETINAAIEYVNALMIRSFEAKLNECKSHFEALKLYENLPYNQRRVLKEHARYGQSSEAIPSYIYTESNENRTDRNIQGWMVDIYPDDFPDGDTGEELGSASSLVALTSGNAVKTDLFVIGYTMKTVSRSTKLKLSKYLFKCPGTQSSHICLINTDTVPRWLQGANVVDYQTIRDIKVKGKKREAKPTKYLRYDKDYERTVPVTDLSDAFAWVQVGEDLNQFGLLNTIESHISGFVVVVYARSLNKFQRENPHIPHLKDFAQKWLAENNTDVVQSLDVTSRRRNQRYVNIASIADSVKDPFFKQFTVTDATVLGHKFIDSMMSAAEVASIRSVSDSGGDAVAEAIVKYPLLQDSVPGYRSSPGWETATIEYVNALYEVKYEEATE